MSTAKIYKPIDEIPLNCVVMVINDKPFIVNVETGELYD